MKDGKLEGKYKRCSISEFNKNKKSYARLMTFLNENGFKIDHKYETLKMINFIDEKEDIKKIIQNCSKEILKTLDDLNIFKWRALSYNIISKETFDHFLVNSNYKIGKLVIQDSRGEQYSKYPIKITYVGLIFYSINRNHDCLLIMPKDKLEIDFFEEFKKSDDDIENVFK